MSRGSDSSDSRSILDAASRCTLEGPIVATGLSAEVFVHTSWLGSASTRSWSRTVHASATQGTRARLSDRAWIERESAQK
eukprot:3310258-Prymnesium_polylepis.1